MLGEMGRGDGEQLRVGRSLAHPVVQEDQPERRQSVQTPVEPVREVARSPLARGLSQGERSLRYGWMISSSSSIRANQVWS